MISKLAYTMILGKPVVMYGGILAFFLLLLAALIGFLNTRGIRIMPFSWHPKLALAAIIVALIHGIFGLSVYFGF